MVLRYWAKVGSIGLVVATISFGAGYKICSNSHKADRLEDAERIIQEASERYEQDMELLMDSSREFGRIKEIIRYVDKETPKVETPECTDLGNDWIRLYNQSIEAANMSGTPESSE